MGPFAKTSDRTVQAAAKGRLRTPCPQRDSAAATGEPEPAPGVTSQWDPSHLRSLSPVNIKLRAFLFPFFLLYFKKRLLFLTTFKI